MSSSNPPFRLHLVSREISKDGQADLVAVEAYVELEDGCRLPPQRRHLARLQVIRMAVDDNIANS